MTEFTPARLAELREVLEHAKGSSTDQSFGYDDYGYLVMGKGIVLALIARVEELSPRIHFEYGIGKDARRVSKSRSRDHAIEGAERSGRRVFRRIQKRRGNWPSGLWTEIERENHE